MSPVYHSGYKSTVKTLTDEPKNAVPQFDAQAEAKSLLRTARAAALATLAQPSGHPFASLVNVATAPDGSPILLLSRLAAHTRHLDTDPRLSLLLYSAFNMPSGGDPLTHPRRDRLRSIADETSINPGAERCARPRSNARRRPH